MVCPFTSQIAAAPEYRIDFVPSSGNGLTQPSQLMADKVMTIPRHRLGKLIGSLTKDEMSRVERALAFVLGFADRPEVAP